MASNMNELTNSMILIHSLSLYLRDSFYNFTSFLSINPVSYVFCFGLFFLRNSSHGKDDVVYILWFCDLNLEFSKQKMFHCWTIFKLEFSFLSIFKINFQIHNAHLVKTIMIKIMSIKFVIEHYAQNFLILIYNALSWAGILCRN